MIADRTGPAPLYLVLCHDAAPSSGPIRAAGACLSLARRYLTLIGRRTPHSSIRRHG